MKRFEIDFTFAGGPQQTVEKTDSTEKRAIRQLYSQIGNTSRLNIIAVRERP
jgi:hypothetical protein